MPRRNHDNVLDDSAPVMMGSKFLVYDETSGDTSEADVVLVHRDSKVECILCEKPTAGHLALRFENTDDFQVCVYCVNANLTNRTFRISTS